jgi:hypothetical protein
LAIASTYILNNCDPSLEGERCIATVYGKDQQISTPLKHCRSLSSVLAIGYDVVRRPCKAGRLVNFPLGLISGASSSPEWAVKMSQIDEHCGAIQAWRYAMRKRKTVANNSVVIGSSS